MFAPGVAGATAGGGGFWLLISAAFAATEGGRAGASVGTLAPPPAAGAELGSVETVCPSGLVIVATLVVLLMTTVLWILLKMIGFDGGAT